MDLEETFRILTSRKRLSSTDEELDREFHLMIMCGDEEIARLKGYTLRQLHNKEHLDEWYALHMDFYKNKWVEGNEYSISAEEMGQKI